MVSCFAPLSPFNADRRSVFGLMSSTQNRSRWTLESGKSAFCHLYFFVFKCSQADECAIIGNCKISNLLFANDMILRFVTQSGLQRASNIFAKILVRPKLR